MRSSAIVLIFSVSFAASVPVLGQQGVRGSQQGGVQYRELRERVRVPVAEMKTEQRQQTVYRLQSDSKVHETKYTVWVPVTQYRWEAFRTGVLNPFVPTSIAYRWVPYTCYQPRTATVSVPVTQQQWVPETRTVDVPVRTLRFVEKEQVRQVAVAPTVPPVNAGQGSSVLATRPNYGGVRMESDPPRIGPTAPSIRR
jgi:hypothetical protein